MGHVRVGVERACSPDSPRAPQGFLGRPAGSADVELVAIVEGVRYDEATNLLTVRQDSGVPEFQDHVNRALDRIAKLAVFKEAVPAKLFQTEHSYGVLFAVRQPGSGHKKFICVRSHCVGVPNVLQRTTAEIIAQALKLSSFVRCMPFNVAKCGVRLICSDRYAAQFVAERLIQAERPGWTRLHLG
eukprot:6812392-Pyramimonas_sp.AAC.1